MLPVIGGSGMNSAKELLHNTIELLSEEEE
jgi:hypothetical protein